jgi:hypothetical protein
MAFQKFGTPSFVCYACHTFNVGFVWHRSVVLTKHRGVETCCSTSVLTRISVETCHGASLQYNTFSETFRETSLQIQRTCSCVFYENFRKLSINLWVIRGNLFSNYRPQHHYSDARKKKAKMFRPTKFQFLIFNFPLFKRTAVRLYKNPC